MKDVQATEGSFSPQKRTSSTSKHELFESLQFFLFLWACPVRIRIQPTKINVKPCGSGLGSRSTTLVIWLPQYVAGYVKSVLKTKQDFPNEKS
jgi:hypothetical protein